MIDTRARAQSEFDGNVNGRASDKASRIGAFIEFKGTSGKTVPASRNLRREQLVS
jgi:hypothetical protein